MIERNILIVDHSLTIREMASLTLKFKGYNTTAKDNSKGAWEILQKKEFDLVIMGREESTTDGLGLLVKIKADKKLKNKIRVILISEGDEAERQRAKDLGAHSCLIKRFYPEELLSKVEQLVK